MVFVSARSVVVEMVANPTIGVSNASGSLNSLASEISDTLDTQLYRNTVNRGQRSDKALLSVVAECSIEGILHSWH